MVSKLRRGAIAGIASVGLVAATALGAGPAQAAQGQVLGAGTEDAIADSYLVVLKDQAGAQARDAGAINTAVANVAAKAQELAGKVSAQVTRSFGAALQGFAVHASEADAKRLAARDDVAYVVQNHQVHASETQDNPTWGLDRVDQHDLPLDKKYNYDTKADNVTAYVIDTGVRASHKEFGGRVSGGKDFVDNDNDPNDGNGHGTHVAGTIGGATYGLAKGVKITPVRVLDAKGSGSTEQVVAGIDWVAQNAKGPSVANMSLGGSADKALDDAVSGAIGKGVTFGVAAGNESADAGNSSPSRVKEAITVAASDNKDGQASFSNYGSVVDLYAPGVDITSAWNTSDDATNKISGTSMATPHVVGAAALYLAAHPDAKPAAVSDGLTGAATSGKITNPTGSTPNKLLYTGK